jgi:hypothetical protein
MSAVLQKANSGPLADIPVHATEPIVMNRNMTPVSFVFVVSGISIVTGYPTDTTILG